MERPGSGLRVAACVLAAGLIGLTPGMGEAALRVEVVAAPNFVVDSNVESPSSYGPRSAYIEARFINDGTNALTNVVAYIGNYVDGLNDTPGYYPTNRHVAYPTIVGPLTNGTFALNHEGGTAGLADATRPIGTLAPGATVVQYWLVGYPTKDVNGKAVWGPSIKPDDDLQLQYDIWATAEEAGAKRTAVDTQTVTLRNEISAMANKIFPNTANKVPLEYQAMLQQYAPAWTNVASDGTPGTPITTEGVWYDLGNVGQGFDADLDLVPDRDLWMQPVGDPAIFDPGSFRLFRTYVLIIVKLKTGGEQVITAVNQLYFKNLPENNGAVGYVRYDFLTLKPGYSTLTPYQEVASGADNEKFNGDYGATLGLPLSGGQTAATLSKDTTVAATAPGGVIPYTISFTNAGTLPLGNPSVGLPLVVQERIPPGARYVAGSASASNTLPAGVAGYALLYTTNNGASWQATEPAAATNVTDIQWWLSDPMPTGTSGRVNFSVRVDSPYVGYPPLLVNTGALAFGNSAPFLTDPADTLITGTNRLGDTVYADNGSGNGTLGNALQDGAEPGISNITVRLYWDANTNGLADAGDVYLASTVTAANGLYGFASLADGRYVVVVDATDPDLPFGYTPTTPTTRGSDLDSGRTTANSVVDLTVDFGFAPALTMQKTLTSTNAFREGLQATYSIVISNNLPGNGLGGGSLTPYTAWATNSTATAAEWQNYTNVFIPPGPDGNYTRNDFSGATKLLTLANFPVGVQNGNVSNVALVLPIVMVPPIGGDDTFLITVKSLAPAATLFSATYMATSLVSGTWVVPMTGTVAWTWGGFATNYTVTLSAEKNSGGAPGGVIMIDAVGFRITSDQATGGASPTTTLSPVPLTDRYDGDQLQFVSATPAPTHATTNGTAPDTVGSLYWNNVGPIYPGGTSTVSVTFRLLEPPNNTNSVVTNITWVTNAFFLGGRPANTATSSVVTTLRPAATLGNYVWRDLNGDGLQNETNTGIANVAVSLTPPAGIDLGRGAGLAITNFTDASGFYLFESIPATGVYTVRVVTATLPGGTGMNTFDEDGTLNSQTAVFLDIYANNTNNTHLTTDYGYQVGSTIEGTIWNDVNRNGTNVPENGEGWLTNVIVYLYSTNSLSTPIATNRSNANGYFSFTGSYTGGYVVVVATNTGAMTNQTWVQSFDTDAATRGLSNSVAVTVVSGGSARADFSYYQLGTYSIGDQLFYDWNSNGLFEAATEEGIKSITVSLYEDANTNGVVDAGVDALVALTQTDTTGYYLFTSLPPGTYQVIVDQGDAEFPPLYLPTADPYPPKDGRSVVTLTTASNTNQDFGYWPYGAGSIGDTVWLDVNADTLQNGATERGLSNVTVSLFADMNGDGTYVLRSTASTDANGKYLFASLPDGIYQVRVDPADPDLPKDAFGYGVIPTTATNVTATIINATPVWNADFGFAALAAVGDTIFWDLNANGSQDWGEPGVSNVTVSLYRDANSNGVHDAGETLVATRTTTNNGTYLFSGLTPGRYVVAVDTNSGPLAGMLLTADPDNDGLPYGDPGATNYDSQVGVRLTPGGSFMGADFGYQPPGIIGDLVWIDANTNGVRDAGEYGIPYVTVLLYSNTTVIASNRTDADGYYSFGNLPNGTYAVVVVTNDPAFPATLAAVYDPDGTRDSRASAIEIAGGHITTVNGGAWTTGDLAIDFGYKYAGDNVLSGTVGMDAMPFDGVLGKTGSGVATNESPFANVSVYVTQWRDANSNETPNAGETVLLGSTVTDTNGDYRFTGLPGATGASSNYYIVSLSAPASDLTLTTTNGSTSARWVNSTTNAQGSSVSTYQVVSLAPVTTNIDFAYTLAGRFDFGDLPGSYSTSIQDSPQGARHQVSATPDLFLGATVDQEVNGAPTADALGDDLAGVDDEDGVIPVGAWREAVSGAVVRVTVGAGTGWLCGYFDFNRNGSFADGGELAISRAVSNTGGNGSGVYTQAFLVPAGTFPVTNAVSLYARFRLFDVAPGTPAAAWSGRADNGEVEDYRWDFGAVGDTVWLDANGNGTRDPGEAPLTNVTVYADLNTNGVRDPGEPYAVTDTNGIYGIGGFMAGNLVIAVETNTLPSGAFATFDADGGADSRAALTLASGEVTSVIDFGYRTGSVQAAVGDLVWEDRNRNGLQDAGEPGLAGVTVTLCDAASNLVGTVTTDVSGAYRFTNLTAGAYFLTFDTLPGYAFTMRDAGTSDDVDSDVHPLTGVTSLFVLPAGVTDLRWDAGLVPTTGVIGDRVWLDEDGDGVQDAGEAGIANVSVTLLASNGTTLAATVTDTEGRYLFAGLAADVYTVRVETNSMPAGLAANPTFDPDGTLNHRTTVTLGAGENWLTADFGYNWVPPADTVNGTGTGAIGDRVWSDADGDGVQDPGEPGLSNVIVQLYRDAGGNGVYTTLVATTTTDASGMYIFDALPPDAYVVMVNGGAALAGYTATGDPDPVLDNRTTTPILLAPGDVYVNADFGYQPAASGLIGDLVWFDANADGIPNGAEAGLAGVSVALIRDSNGNGTWDAGEPIIATTVTATNGAYSFAGVPVDDGVGTDDYLVWVNDAGGVLDGLTPTYDANGIGTANLSVVADLTGAGNTLQDFGYMAAGQSSGRGLIGDTIFLDRDGDHAPGPGEGLEGITVELYTTNRVLLAVMTTGADGRYAFGGLNTNNAAYLVQVVTSTLPVGVTNSVDPDGGILGESIVVLTGASPVNLAQDFGYRAAAPNVIEGTLWVDVNADGTLGAGETERLAGITVVLYDTNGNAVAATVTDAGGNYAFEGLPDGTYRVDVTDAGNLLNGWWHSDGPSAGADNNSQVDPYTVAVSGGQTNRTADFGYFIEGGAAGNRIWLDVNGNGIQEAGETGLSNVTVRLTAIYANGSTTTVYTVSGTNGFYSFGSLLLDESYITSSPSYQVSIPVIPSGYYAVPKYAGTNIWLDSGYIFGQPVAALRGVTDLELQADPRTEPLQGSYDFGFDNQPTLAVISGFRAYTEGGRTWVQWETAAELGTVGYYLDRLTDTGWTAINPELLLVNEMDPLPHVYRLEDAGAASGGTYTWRVVEFDIRGRLIAYGPYTVTVDGLPISYEAWAAAHFPDELAPQATRDADPDGDGLTNFEEYLAGTNPGDRNSLLRVTGLESRPDEGVTVLRWESETDRSYGVEVSTNLAFGFLPFERGIAATPPGNVHTVRVHTASGSVYFRVVTE